MEDLKSNVEELNEFTPGGKILDAFEKFYSQELVMQDNNYPQ